jgi:folate-binding protein YgfZ
MTKIARLPQRCVIQVSGEDRLTFLQGLVSNDVTLVAPGVAVWAALLTPQGKWLSDFFMFSGAESILLDCEAGQATDIARRLLRYRLRARVDIASTDLVVYAAWDGEPPAAAYSAPDPRLPVAGWRLLSPDAIETSAGEADYDVHRIMLGLPDGSRDLEPEKSVLLEAGFAELNGISWTKGCYMGQELTARTRYRGLLKRRLVPVLANAALPPPGTPVFIGSVEAGVLRSTCNRTGLALLRLESFAPGLSCGGMTLEICLPGWLGHSA